MKGKEVDDKKAFRALANNKPQDLLEISDQDEEIV